MRHPLVRFVFSLSGLLLQHYFFAEGGHRLPRFFASKHSLYQASKREIPADHYDQSARPSIKDISPEYAASSPGRPHSDGTVPWVPSLYDISTHRNIRAYLCHPKGQSVLALSAHFCRQDVRASGAIVPGAR